MICMGSIEIILAIQREILLWYEIHFFRHGRYMTTDEFIPDAIRVILRPYLVILPYGHFRKTLTFYIVNVRVMYKSSSFEILAY